MVERRYGQESAVEVNEGVVGQFLRDAPFLEGADDLGAATSAIDPWPHQLRVVRDVVARFPASRLFCDEVGLGKTVEAGLALRQLWITGRVRRALLLVPRAVLRQWQEELWEKFVLDVPRYDGNRVVDRTGRTLPCGRSPWELFPLLLASSHLARRSERHQELLDATPWDVVIIDEAHHARRRGAQVDRWQPNRLLQLLQGHGDQPGLRDRTEALWLLTATPMQVHPVEVWDLLRLLGMGGRWGASAEDFIAYHQELQSPASGRRWDFLLAMLREHRAMHGGLAPTFVARAERELGATRWQALLRVLDDPHGAGSIASLDAPSRDVLDALLRHHTPVQQWVYRNTRDVLRRYHAKGMLGARVPDRRPANVWVELQPDERTVYDAVEDYIAETYERSERKRRGAGFVMTVYRRRLTSSFAALRSSLARRLAWCRGEAEEWADPDEDEGDDLDDEAEAVADPKAKLAAHREEARRLAHFIESLDALTGDSKFDRFSGDLRAILRTDDAVIVFTQYTDTLDWLRARLAPVWGDQVASYTGRGGERWNGTSWTAVPKEALKDAFLRREVSILLCTESASEGLNLQTCRVLINYDMPWNPMRVEQRIGRIDRIGQRAAEVLVYNYFYQETVEATVYARLGERIDAFTHVVGQLQPILHAAGRAIERLAMTARARRDGGLQDALDAMDAQAEHARLPLFAAADDDAVEPLRAPVSLATLAATLPVLPSLHPLLQSAPDNPALFHLNLDGHSYAVTFDRAVYDQHPDSVRLLTWGDPLFAQLLARVPSLEAGDGPLARVEAADGRPLVGWFGPGAHAGRPRALADFASLTAALGEAHARSPGTDASLEEPLRRRLELARAAQARTHDARRSAERATLLARFEALLRVAGLCEYELTQREGLLRRRGVIGFGTDAVESLATRGSPWKPMLAELRRHGRAVPRAEPSHPDWPAIERADNRSLEQRLVQLKNEGTEQVSRYAQLDRSSPVSAPAFPPLRVQRFAVRAVSVRPTPPPVAPPRVSPANAATAPRRTRGLSAEDGITRALAALEQQRTRWFDAPAREGTPATPTSPAPAPWLAVVEHPTRGLDLVLVVPPQPALAEEIPPNRRVLTLDTLDAVEGALVTNVAGVGVRREVPPRTAPYRWSLKGRPDDARDVLDPLTVAGLPDDVTTAFRLDLEGPSQRLTGAVLRPGQRYALLVPPRHAEVELPSPPTRRWDGGWRALAFELPEAPDVALRAALARLGLTVAQESLRLGLRAIPPDAWRATPRGDVHPCFSARRAPVIDLRASRRFEADEVVLLCAGPTRSERHTLPAGSRWTFALDGLEAGPWALRALTDDPAVELATLYLSIDPDATGAWARDVPSVVVDGQRLDPGTTWECDLRREEGDLFSILGPPGAPWRLRWEGPDRWRTPWDSLAAPDAPVAGRWIETLREALEHAPLGRVEVDLGAEGMVTLHHAWRLSARRRSLLLDRFQRHLAELPHALELRRDAPALFHDLWLAPMLRLLGWQVGAEPIPLPDAAALPLARLEAHGTVFRWRTAALLVWVDGPLERARWESPLGSAVRSTVQAHGVAHVSVTDGPRWWRVDPTRRALPRHRALDPLPDDEGLDDFLYDHAAWG